MRHSTVLDLKKINFLGFVLKNKLIFLLCLFFALGVASGTLIFPKSDVVSRLAESAFKSYFTKRISAKFISVIFSSVISSFLMLLLTFLSGASLLGVILVPLVIAWRGLWFGALSSYIYSVYGLKGIAFNAIILIPPSVIALVALLLAARESISFSLVFAKLTLPKSHPLNLYIDFKNYCGRYIIMCVIVLISALIDAVISCSFIKYFEFL